jgi:molecular chaperone DnaJ
MSKDYYKILGVEKDATKEEIKKAYKKLAKKYHPDISKEKDAEQKFKEINEAAAVLGDDKKRQQYDQFGSADGFQGFGGFDSSAFRGAGFNFDDIFEMFSQGFGFGGGRGRRAIRGSDLRYDVEITLEEAAKGFEKQIVVTKLAECSHCSGSGAENPEDMETCEDCGGRGITTVTRRTPFGMFQSTTTCKKCAGEGKVAKELCSMCDGEGRVEKNVKLKIEIPAGVENGNRLRVAGEGEAGEKGGRPGDLYVFIHVKEHKIFERKGSDLYVSVPISFGQASLGSEIEVPTLEGKAKLKIPAGTQSHTMFKMKGKGIKRLGGYGVGDEYVKAIIETPKKLSSKQKEAIKKFDSEVKNKKGFLNKVFA